MQSVSDLALLLVLSNAFIGQWKALKLCASRNKSLRVILCYM